MVPKKNKWSRAFLIEKKRQAARYNPVYLSVHHTFYSPLREREKEGKKAKGRSNFAPCPPQKKLKIKKQKSTSIKNQKQIPYHASSPVISSPRPPPHMIPNQSFPPPTDHPPSISGPPLFFLATDRIRRRRPLGRCPHTLSVCLSVHVCDVCVMCVCDACVCVCMCGHGPTYSTLPYPTLPISFFPHRDGSSDMYVRMYVGQQGGFFFKGVNMLQFLIW